MNIIPEIQELINRGALFVINNSGGKDSQCMTIKMIQRIPTDQLLVIHAHLPEQEWDGTYQHITNTVRDILIKKVVATKTFFQMVERRQRVAQLKAQGLSHSKIAMRMGITIGTSERDYKLYKMEVKQC